MIREKTTVPQTFPFIICFSLLKTTAIVLPGIMVVMKENSFQTWTWLLLLFLFLSELLHVFDYYYYKNQQTAPKRLEALQLILVVSICAYLYQETTVEISILIAVYGLSQLLVKIAGCTYLISFWYILIQSCFDGFIFNFILSAVSPYFLTSEIILFFAFSLVLSFVMHFSTQLILTNGRKKTFLFLAVALLIVSIIISNYAALKSQSLSFSKAANITIELLVFFLILFFRTNWLQKLFALYSLNVVILLTYYYPLLYS